MKDTIANVKKETNRIIIYIVMLALLTAVFRLFDLDLIIQKALYDFSSGSWKFAYNSFVLWLYKYGTYPAIILAAAAVVAFSLGFAYEKIKKHRKAALLIILLMFIGPGIITNVILKNYTGRPRPRDVKEFNGSMDFLKPLEPGVPGKGFSFPCGHCTMGFFFYAGYLILRRKNKAAAYGAFGGSIIYGTAMGFGRMAQGGHFASDVVWAAGIMLLTAEVLHIFVIKTDDKAGLFENVRINNKPLVFGAALALLAVTTLLFLIATPFNKNREYSFGELSGAEIVSDRAAITVASMPEGSLKFAASGFGLPWSDYDDFMKTDGSLIYMASSRGFFSELNSSVKAYLRPDSMKSVTLTAGAGDINFEPGNGAVLRDVLIYTERGNVAVVLPENIKFLPGAVIDIKAPKGSVIIKNYGNYFKDLNSEAEKMAGATEFHVKPFISGSPEMKVSADSINIVTKQE